MKTIKILTLVSLLFAFNSCSLTVDIDDLDELGRINASATGDNSDGSVSVGGYLEVEVSVFDRDGISTIQIEIPAINIDFLTSIKTSEYTGKITQSFNVNEIDANKSKTIFITLTDKDGNRYTKTISFNTN